MNELMCLLRSSFTSDEEQMFVQHFQLYLAYGQDETKFIVDMDDVWKWMGFSQKVTAAKHLTKRFVVGIDFTVSKLMSTGKHGGHNKELIMMNVDTFKQMCMVANTEKGKLTRKYYLKMEKVFLEYQKKEKEAYILELQNNTLIAKELERHNTLRNTCSDRPCVYLLKTDRISNIVKIGETDDLKTRLVDLKNKYNDGFLIDVFPCINPHALEQYILKRPDVKLNRIPATETIQCNETFTVDHLTKLIKKYQKMYNVNYCTFDQKHALAQAKIKARALKAIMTETNVDKREKLYDLLSNPCNNDDVLGVTSDKDDDDTDNKDIESDRKVYKYTPNDLENPIASFPSLKAAARSCKTPTIHDYHIRAACLNNTVFAEHRWFYTDDEENQKEDVPVIPPTQEEVKAPPKRKGRVAQLNPDKTQIINVWPNQTTASKALKIPACSITTAITTQRQYGGFKWEMYDEISDELKATFKGEVPKELRAGTCNKSVNRIDPDTDAILETYACVQDVCSLFKTSHKTVHKVSASGDIFKGFKWALAV
jgi:phage anti-repressor protein